jgi:hypothetical protein
MGRSAQFICKAWGYPDITFKWKSPVKTHFNCQYFKNFYYNFNFKIKANNDISNSSKYIIINSKLESQIFQSTLLIYSISSGDYGSFICEARNEIGSTVNRAILSGKRKLYFSRYILFSIN